MPIQEIQKSIVEIEEMFRQILCDLFGLDVENSGDRIRFVWGSNIDVASQSAPNLFTEKDICFIQPLPEDNAYNRQRDIRYIHESGDDMTAVDEHTDVHNVLFINYGPNAYEFARKIRNGLHRDNIRRFLRLNKFALVTDVPAIRRVPELVNANWVNRADVSAVFNQFVRITGTMRTIEQVGVRPIIEPGGTSGGSGEPEFPAVTWPDGTPQVDEESGADLRAGVNLMQENSNITMVATLRKE